MTSITIEQVKNGWIVKEMYAERVMGQSMMVPASSGLLVFRSIEEIAKELPNILTETRVTESK